MKTKLHKVLGVALPIMMVLALAITLLPANTPTAEAAVGQLRFERVTLPKIGSAGDYFIAPDTDIGAFAVSADGSVIFAADNSTLTSTTVNMAADLTAANTTGVTVLSATDFRASGVVKIGTELIFYTTTDATNLKTLTRGYGLTTAAIATNATAVDERVILYKSTDGGRTWSLAAFTQAALLKTDNTPIVGVKLSPEYATDSTLFVATQQYVYQSVDGGKSFSAMQQPTGWDTDEIINDMDVGLDSGGRASLIIGTSENTSGYGDVYVYCPATTGLSWKAQGIADASVNYNVLAVAFSPNFASDEGIFAVTTDDNLTAVKTIIQSSFGYTKDGEGWGTSIGDGEFLNAAGTSISTTTRARIAFPDDFDVDSSLSNTVFVGLVAGAEGNTSTEFGDAYKVTCQPSASSTEDLNVRGLVSITRTATNIWSIAVTGNAAAAKIIVGTNFWSTGVANYYWTAYYSNDSGATWSTAREWGPTGAATGYATTMLSGAKVEVVMAPKFATSGVAYASTSGADTSAFSRTADGGKSWQQISLIDWADTINNYTITNHNQTSANPNDFRLLLRTVGPGGTTDYQGSVFETTNGGGNYERIFSYANPGVATSINSQAKTGTTFFVVDYTSGKFWRSSDSGKTYPRIITARAAITAYSVLSPDNILTGHSDGAYWYTTTAGRPWTKPDESEIDGSITQISQSGDNVLVGSAIGKVFISTNAGVTFKRLGVGNPGTGATYIGRDPAYATNKFAYAAVYAANGGVWRIAVNEADPASTEWKRIDSASTGYDTVKPLLVLYLGGVMYSWDVTAVAASDGAGGIWRCTNPTSDIDGTDPPMFYKESTGLTLTHVYSHSAVGTSPNTFYAKDTTSGATYNEVLWAMADVLSTPATLVAPANQAKDQGTTLSTIDLVLSVTISWQAVTGAISYEYQVATDALFKSLFTTSGASTPGQQVVLSNFLPGQTYYWRVRALTPLRSPWSEIRSFTVVKITEKFDLTSPARGATDVDVMPIFLWKVFDGAIGYEIMVAEDPTFAIIDWSRSSTQTMYKSEEALAYGTTYYWRVRGVTGPAPAKAAAPGGAWATGIFTTMKKPVEPTPAVITITEPAPPAEIKVVEIPVPGPAQAIPDYLLWIVIVVGAVLVIALIVLIVRTRRVA